MFTGIIREIGIVEKVGKTVRLKAEKTTKGKKVGDSIAVNGVCLTITKLSKTSFEAEIITETAKRTNIGTLQKGDLVNLEPAAKCTDSLDGHFVLGHVDTKGKVTKFNRDTLVIKYPEKFGKYMAWKGPITINGVNLTIADLQENTVTTCLIPHTIKTTNLGNLKKGDEVNIEVDILARYIERMLDHKGNQATYQFLRDRNLI